MATSHAVAASRLEVADTVLVLRSTWSYARMGKSFRLGPDSRAAEPEKYRLGTLFVPETVAVRDIRGLHELWERLALAGDAVCVRGTLSGQYVPKGTKVGNKGRIELRCDHVTRRNGGLHSDGLVSGLGETSHRWLFLDMDEVLNVKGLDPRTQPDAALRFLLGLLPGTIQQATVSWNWSSSMCVGVKAGQAPERLSAHLRIWLDQPLDCQQTRALLEQLREHAWLRLGTLGVVRDGKHDKVVDPKVSEAQQPLYLAAPKFVGELQDPLPGAARRGLLVGRSDVVCLADLEKQLAAVLPVPPAPSPAEPRRRAPAHAKKGKSARAAPRPLPEMDGGQAGVVPFSAALRLERAKKHRNGRSGGERICADRALFAARASLEVVRLVRGRVEQGATDRRWKAWHDAGGVPEGQRDMILFLTGCLIAESLDVADLTDAKVNQAILEIGYLIVDHDWLREAWVKGHYWSSLVGRAVADGRGEDEVWRGVLKSKSYWVGKARMLRELRVRPEEVARYGLLSLATDQDRLAAERLGNGATPRCETQEKNARKVGAARRFMAKGCSLREAARKVEMDASQLSRLLRAEAARKEAARQDQVRSTDVPDGSVDSSSAGRGKQERKRGGEQEFSPSYTDAQTPVAVAPAADPWGAVAERYLAIAAAAGRRGVDGQVVVPRPEADAPEEVQEAYRAALEGLADARRRAEKLRRRRHGPAQAVRAWYDALSELPVPEAVARVKTRRRELYQTQKAEMAAALADGAGEGAVKTLSLRHVGAWAVENRHAARVLGQAWAPRPRPEDDGPGMSILRGPGHSTEWRHAMKTAQGLVLLTEEERHVVLAARAAEADGEAERDDVRLLHRAVQIALAA